MIYKCVWCVLFVNKIPLLQIFKCSVNFPIICSLIRQFACTEPAEFAGTFPFDFCSLPGVIITGEKNVAQDNYEDNEREDSPMCLFTDTGCTSVLGRLRSFRFYIFPDFIV